MKESRTPGGVPAGSRALKARPTTMPGRVMTFGSRWCSRSMAKRATSSGREHQTRHQDDVEAEDERVGEVDRHRYELDDRVAHRDAGPALAALATENQVAEHRNVVRPAQHVSAVRAARPRAHDRFTARQAVNAHVQEAPDREAEDRQSDEREGRVGHEGGCRCCGNGDRLELLESETRPVAGSSSNGVPTGSSGIPRRTRRRTSASHVYWPPAGGG